MGNCVKSTMKAEEVHDEEERSKLEDQALLKKTNGNKQDEEESCSSKRKKRVSFKVEPDEDAAGVSRTSVPRRKNGRRAVRVRVVLTQAELKQILKNAGSYPSCSSSSSVNEFVSPVPIMLNRMRSRRSSTRSGGISMVSPSWSPALRTIPEDHY